MEKIIIDKDFECHNDCHDCAMYDFGLCRLQFHYMKNQGKTISCIGAWSWLVC